MDGISRLTVSLKAPLRFVTLTWSTEPKSSPLAPWLGKKVNQSGSLCLKSQRSKPSFKVSVVTWPLSSVVKILAFLLQTAKMRSTIQPCVKTFPRKTTATKLKTSRILKRKKSRWRETSSIRTKMDFITTVLMRRPIACWILNHRRLLHKSKSLQRSK